MTQERTTQALLRFFEECLLSYIKIAGGGYLMIYHGANGCWPLFWHIHGSRIICSSLLPVTVPEEKITGIARYLHQANYALHVGGKFEFDEAAGEIRFNTVLDIADGTVTTCMLFALYDAHRIADFHLQRLLKILLFSAWPTGSPLDALPVLDESTHEWLQQGDLIDLLQEINSPGRRNGSNG